MRDPDAIAIHKSQYSVELGIAIFFVEPRLLQQGLVLSVPSQSRTSGRMAGELNGPPVGACAAWDLTGHWW